MQFNTSPLLAQIVGFPMACVMALRNTSPLPLLAEICMSIISFVFVVLQTRRHSMHLSRLICVAFARMPTLRGMMPFLTLLSTSSLV